MMSVQATGAVKTVRARPGGSPVIEALNLVKRYGDFTAVDKLTLRVYEGEVFGLLGPNGAGKTTTVLMLLGLTEPSEGEAKVCGHNSTREPLQVKRIVGYLPDNVGFYEELTARENLRYIAALNGIGRREADERIGRLLERVGLGDVADQRTGTFSRGMRQRLGIADVLVKAPRVVILDEPAIGLDPEGIQDLLGLIAQMSREEKITVMLSSHQLHQVQQVCDRVGIFVRGKLVAEGPVETLGDQIMAGQPQVIELKAEPLGHELVEALRRIEGVKKLEKDGDLMVVTAERDVRAEMARRVVAGGAALLHLRLKGYGLEDIYLKYFHEER